MRSGVASGLNGWNRKSPEEASMYPPHELLRVNHDERLRQAEIRRQVKQAADDARESARIARRGRRESGLLRGLGLRRPVSQP